MIHREKYGWNKLETFNRHVHTMATGFIRTRVGAVMSTSPVTWRPLEVLPLNEALYPAFYDHRVRQEAGLQLGRHLHQWGVGRHGGTRREATSLFNV